MSKKVKIIIPIIIVLLLIVESHESLCIFCKHTENTYLKSEQQTAKCIKIILMTVLKTK